MKLVSGKLFVRRLASAVLAAGLVFGMTWLALLPVDYFGLDATGGFGLVVFMIVWWSLFAVIYRLTKPLFEHLDQSGSNEPAQGHTKGD
jgi:hypothetical protein